MLILMVYGAILLDWNQSFDMTANLHIAVIYNKLAGFWCWLRETFCGTNMHVFYLRKLSSIKHFQIDFLGWE